MALKSFIVTIIGVAIAGGSVYLAKEICSTPAARPWRSRNGELVDVIVAGTDPLVLDS